MAGRISFEFHTFLIQKLDAESQSAKKHKWDDLDWRETDRPEVDVLAIDGTLSDGHLGGAANLVGFDQDKNRLHLVEDEQSAVAEFHVVQRRLGTAPVMIRRQSDVLVNGLPSLSLTVLVQRDAMVLAPGAHTYLTERFQPHVGPPTPEMIGQRCPFCQVDIEEGTWVVTHRCGVAYHHETESTHPDVPPEDRLNCFEQVRNCLVCKRTVTKEETLLWDPASI